MEKVRERLRRIAECSSGSPLFVAFSGGKDSTALFLSVREAGIENFVRVGLIYADTLMEIPQMHNHALSVVEHAKACGFEAVVVSPPPGDTFWVNILGRGYPPPRPWFRWCQQRLKIQPVRRALLEVEGIVVVGSRRDESTARSRAIRSGADEKLRGIPVRGGRVKTFAPMHDVTISEVWSYLILQSSEVARRVVELYRKAGGPRARFGCWCCTVVARDRTMEALAETSREAGELLKYRQLLLELSRKKENRLPFSRNGKAAKNGMGMLRLSVRKVLLDELLKLERRLGFTLITPAEISEIHRIWELETDASEGNKKPGGKTTRPGSKLL